MSRYQTPRPNKDFTGLEGGLKSERIRQEYPHMRNMLGQQEALETLAKFYGVTPEYARACTTGHRRNNTPERTPQ